MLTILVRVKILTDALASVAIVWIRACCRLINIRCVLVFIFVSHSGLSCVLNSCFSFCIKRLENPKIWTQRIYTI
jgi:hypothetical protein